MAWSWSHSAEGMQNVRDNIDLLDRETLNIIYAEWKACDAVHAKAVAEWEAEDEEDRSSNPPRWNHNAFDNEVYESELLEAVKIPGDALADYIYERAEQEATCDNGGFNAWVCPSGCGCHCVSFSSAEELAEEENEKNEVVS